MPDPATVQTAPRRVSDMLERLDAMADGLPKRLRQAADFTRRHLHLIAVSTVSDMAAASGVAPSVYMRFCQVLGFSGYSEMQALFRAGFAEFRPDYPGRVAQLAADGPMQSGRLLADFAEAGHLSLMALANTVTSAGLDRTATALAGARVVHLIGLRRAYAVASSMAYLLDKLDIPANLHSAAGLLEDARAILPGDVVFAITFTPFSDETIRLSEAAAAQGVPVHGLTDSTDCPLSRCAQELLIVQEAEVSGFRGLSASIALTTALAVAAGTRRPRG